VFQCEWAEGGPMIADLLVTTGGSFTGVAMAGGVSTTLSEAASCTAGRSLGLGSCSSGWKSRSALVDDADVGDIAAWNSELSE